MTAKMRLLRHLLLMPEGDPVQQEKDVAAVARDLQSGKDMVRAARSSLERGQHLRDTFNRLLERNQ